RRQIELLEQGHGVRPQTRGYNSDRRESYLLRDKEGDHDYRYFPEPDLPPLVIDEALIRDVEAHLPEPPATKRRRFIEDLGLTVYAAEVLTSHPRIASFFEAAALLSGKPVETGKVVQRELLGDMTIDGLTADFPVSPGQLADLVQLRASGAISGPQAKRVYATMKGTDRGAAEIVTSLALSVERDEAALAEIAQQVVAAHPEQVARYRAGKRGLLGFFVGQVMKATDGRAEPKLASALLAAELGEPEEAVSPPSKAAPRKERDE
ncbi:MAG: Asp-tRNA(Asn)/Glu-tRNA(Gln) amidotransferase GatCAB subunit B, partial [Deltaproteobacteria bacterium]